MTTKKTATYQEVPLGVELEGEDGEEEGGEEEGDGGEAQDDGEEEEEDVREETPLSKPDS